MTDKKNPKTRRCGSCALLNRTGYRCRNREHTEPSHEGCDDFEPNDTCRIADALEDLPPVAALIAIHSQMGALAQLAHATGRVHPAEKLETLSLDLAAATLKEIAEMYNVRTEAEPDLSRLEQELRALATSAGAYRGMGNHAEADRYQTKADLVRRCLRILKGEVDPLEVPK